MSESDPKRAAAAGGDYEYDFAVIGGGSGGMAAAKEAARHGAKVVCFDFVKPSPRGTKWGLGGTCVNVGCVPKKLMHYAALLGTGIEDAHHFGWKVPADGVDHTVEFEWNGLVDTVRNHIKSLNFAYKGGLRSANVEYINGLAKFEDPHTLSWQGKKKSGTITAANILIAVGGRPHVPADVPGATEYAITSDDIFYKAEAPGKTLCVGAGYIALECAGFLTEVGYDTSVAVRSMLLRGFDRDCADKIGEVMAANGTKFIQGALPSEIVKGEDGRLHVTLKKADGSTTTDVFDTVLYATGRNADTGGLQLEKAGVVAESNGKFIGVDGGEQTNVPHIYAVGDVLHGRLELTPVAIKASELLARRLFAGATKKMDYEMICTTVFTPSEYGTCGLTEEQAVAKYGADALDTYLWQWTTLEHQAAHRLKAKSVRADIVDSMPANCMSKLICLKAEGGKVVGFHFVGPNAGEITQGFGLAIKVGVTKDDFDDCVGIHPTDAEALCVMDVKRSEIKEAGDWTASGGCGGGKCG